MLTNIYEGSFFTSLKKKGNIDENTHYGIVYTLWKKVLKNSYFFKAEESSVGWSDTLHTVGEGSIPALHEPLRNDK